MQKHNEDNLTQKRRFNLLCDEIHFGKYVYLQMSYIFSPYLVGGFFSRVVSGRLRCRFNR